MSRRAGPWPAIPANERSRTPGQAADHLQTLKFTGTLDDRDSA
jgi:hypothetical protein